MYRNGNDGVSNWHVHRPHGLREHGLRPSQRRQGCNAHTFPAWPLERRARGQVRSPVVSLVYVLVLLTTQPPTYRVGLGVLRRWTPAEVWLKNLRHALRHLGSEPRPPRCLDGAGVRRPDHASTVPALLDDS